MSSTKTQLAVGSTVAGRHNMAIISCGRIAKNWNDSPGYATMAGRTPGQRGHLNSLPRSPVCLTKPIKSAMDQRDADDRDKE